MFIFVLCTLALIPLGNSAADGGAAKDLNTLAYFGIPQQSTSIGIIQYVKAPLNYFQALYNIMTRVTYNNPIFADDYEMVGWLVLSPIYAAFVFGLIITFFQIFRYATS